MRKLMAGAALMLGLLAGTSTLSFAAPSMHAADHREAASRSSSIEHADYYYRHHRYHHRAWDRRHRHWRYW